MGRTAAHGVVGSPMVLSSLQIPDPMAFSLSQAAS